MFRVFRVFRRFRKFRKIRRFRVLRKARAFRALRPTPLHLFTPKPNNEKKDPHPSCSSMAGCHAGHGRSGHHAGRHAAQLRHGGGHRRGLSERDHDVPPATHLHLHLRPNDADQYGRRRHQGHLDLHPQLLHARLWLAPNVSGIYPRHRFAHQYPRRGPVRR